MGPHCRVVSSPQYPSPGYFRSRTGELEEKEESRYSPKYGYVQLRISAGFQAGYAARSGSYYPTSLANSPMEGVP